MLEETYKREYTKENPEITNVKDIITVVRAIIRQEPEFAMKHLFTTHCLHLLMKYISCPYVRDFYVSIFDPNDLSMNLTVKLRENLYKYAY